MTEKKKGKQKPANDQAAPDTPEGEASGGDETAEAAETAGEHTAMEAAEGSEPVEVQTEASEPGVDPLAALEADVAEFRDKHLRALAELENVRRRADKEKADALKYAATNFARDILGVADNLRRAIEAVPADAAAKDETIKNLVLGVELTEKELLSVFERHGIKPIEAEGQKFDHNLHQAMMEVPDTGHPSGTIVQVLQGGYTISDRLLRPAMVGVAKGPSKADDGQTSGSNDGEKGSTVDTSA